MSVRGSVFPSLLLCIQVRVLLAAAHTGSYCTLSSGRCSPMDDTALTPLLNWPLPCETRLQPSEDRLTPSVNFCTDYSSHSCVLMFVKQKLYVVNKLWGLFRMLVRDLMWFHLTWGTIKIHCVLVQTHSLWLWQIDPAEASRNTFDSVKRDLFSLWTLDQLVESLYPFSWQVNHTSQSLQHDSTLDLKRELSSHWFHNGKKTQTAAKNGLKTFTGGRERRH